MLINNTSRCLSGLEDNGSDCLQLPDESHRSVSLSVTEFWLVVAVFASLYGIVFVVGIVGNSLVIYVVARHKPMQTVTNVFIANLAVSDVIMCLLAVPFTPLSALLHSWTFGETICHLMPMAMGITVYVSTLTSTAISVNRYLSTVHPFPAKFSKACYMVLIIFIWIVSMTLSMPLAVYQEVMWRQSDDAIVCQEHWPNVTSRRMFTSASLILQYILPVSIITFCYSKVSFALTRRQTKSQARSGDDAVTSVKQRQRIERKRRTNRMLIVMVLIFVVCWAPLNCVHLMFDYNRDLQDWSYSLLVFLPAHLIAMSSSVYNPFLYAWMSESFKQKFVAILPRFLSNGNDVNVSTNTSPSKYTTFENTAQLAMQDMQQPEHSSDDAVSQI